MNSIHEITDTVYLIIRILLLGLFAYLLPWVYTGIPEYLKAADVPLSKKFWNALYRILLLALIMAFLAYFMGRWSVFEKHWFTPYGL